MADKKKISIGNLVDKTFSALMIVSGVILALIPVFFWDFLITYQFRPTVRPFYPVFYGAIFIAGLAVTTLGVISLLKQFKNLDNRKWYNYIMPSLSAIVGIIMLFALMQLYITTEYLSADNLYLLILTGLFLGIILFLLLTGSGVISIILRICKKSVNNTLKLANFVTVILLLMGITVGAVITLPPDAEVKAFPSDLPYYTTLYSQGDAGYHTFKIPTMITADNGTILAFAEARMDNQEDWGKMDIVVRKSYDLGQTWEPLEVVVADGDNTIGNACPVVDRNTGYIWMIFCKENYTVFKTHSEDNGETWATPEEITSDVKLVGWSWYATGPSHGIQLTDGTLMIPADHIMGRKMQSHVIYSKDGGNSWQLGGTVPGGEEATLAELENGDIYLNTRPVKPGYRVTAISKDKGLSWIEIKNDTSLPDPACQGNLVKVNRGADTPVYLFTNAADSLHREMMTVRMSTDECSTWQYSKVLYEGMASYSAISVIDPENEIIGCIFECGANYYAEQIVFTRFPLEYIMN
jgi:sialidase-1